MTVGLGLSDFAKGASYVMARPGLYKWVAAPFALTLLVLVAVAWGVYGIAAPGADAIASLLPGFLESLLAGVLKALFVAVLAVGGYVVFVAVAAMITAPFCEMLSEAIECERSGEEGPPFSVPTFLRDLVLGILHAVRRVSLFLLSIAAIFLVGAVIPGLGPILATILSGYVTVRFAAFDAMDAVMARKGWRYGQKKSFLRTHSSRTFGLGAAIALLLLVPLVNVVALPFGAAGATLLYLDVAE